MTLFVHILHYLTNHGKVTCMICYCIKFTHKSIKYSIKHIFLLNNLSLLKLNNSPNGSHQSTLTTLKYGIRRSHCWFWKMSLLPILFDVSLGGMILFLSSKSTLLQLFTMVKILVSENVGLSLPLQY